MKAKGWPQRQVGNQGWGKGLIGAKGGENIRRREQSIVPTLLRGSPGQRRCNKEVFQDTGGKNFNRSLRTEKPSDPRKRYEPDEQKSSQRVCRSFTEFSVSSSLDGAHSVHHHRAIVTTCPDTLRVFSGQLLNKQLLNRRQDGGQRTVQGPGNFMSLFYYFQDRDI